MRVIAKLLFLTRVGKPREQFLVYKELSAGTLAAPQFKKVDGTLKEVGDAGV